MKLFKYIWRNVTRNKLRSSLTILSVGFSLALMTVLLGFLAMQDAWKTEAAKYNRIVVLNIQGFSGVLPIASLDRIRNMEGVKDAVPYSWFGGDYGTEKMPFTQFGTDPDHAFNVWDEFKIDPDQLKKWQEERQGCVVERRLAERRGWKIGDKITIKGTYYPVVLELHLCGIFEASEGADVLWYNWTYLDESLRQKKAPRTGNAAMIFAKTTGADVTPQVIETIDAQFASSQYPTRTQTESAFAQMFADMIGNIRLLILLIGLVIAFALTLVTANTMAMSMRERTTEIAVLKAIGFDRLRILAMVLGESCMISLFGGAVGVGLGCLLLEGMHRVAPQFVPVGIAAFVGPWLVGLFALAALVGLVSGILPAVRAAQSSVVNGLRRVV